MGIADNRPMLTELVMKKRCVDKGKAFFMLYQEGEPLSPFFQGGGKGGTSPPQMCQLWAGKKNGVI